MKKKLPKKISASEFDRMFNAGEDMTPYLDMSTAKMDYPAQRINIDIPKTILHKVDLEATRVGVTRTSLIKLWIAEHADRLTAG